MARMAAQGSTNGEIALSLFISVKTVEHHLTSAYSKLGVHSRKDLRACCESEELPREVLAGRYLLRRRRSGRSYHRGRLCGAFSNRQPPSINGSVARAISRVLNVEPNL